jgi:agmatine deiminase
MTVPHGLRMPAEWEPHRATWLAWPHERTDWPGKFAAIPWVFAEIVRNLAPHERVRLLVTSAAMKDRAARVLARTGVDLARVAMHRIATDRSWMRDSGPTFVRRGRALEAVLWSFNAWGARYTNFARDARVSGRVAHIAGARPLRAAWKGRPVVLEGGVFDVDGRGTALATEQCLLDRRQQRNPGFARKDYEDLLRAYLGVRRIVWLKEGIAGDDTHGHIDDCARFVAPGVVAACVEDDRRDANFAPLRDNLSRLRAAGLRVLPLPMPGPIRMDGRRLPASYANFYAANGVVLVPTFNDPADRLALATLARAFPGRRVVGIHAVDLVWGLGTLHCLTQQEPG